MTETINPRLAANREIIRLLSEWCEEAPDQRFGQALSNLGIVQDLHLEFSQGRPNEHGLYEPGGAVSAWKNGWPEESVDTLARVRETLARYEEAPAKPELYSVWRSDYYSGQEQCAGDKLTDREAEDLVARLEADEADDSLDAEEERDRGFRIGYEIRPSVAEQSLFLQSQIRDFELHQKYGRGLPEAALVQLARMRQDLAGLQALGGQS